MNGEAFSDWAILELMGHRRLAGLVSDVELFGARMCRIDIHGPDGKVVTQFYGASAVYAMTPTTEEVARRVAAANTPAPVARWELALPDADNYPDLDSSGEGPF